MKNIFTTLLLLIISNAFFINTTSASLPFSDGSGNKLPTLAPMLQRVTPAVVNIATRGHIQVNENPLFNDPFFRRFFNVPQQPRSRMTQSTGSGVIIDAKNGIVLTNNHVIDKADEIRITLRDGRQLAAKLLGTDPDSDIAVLQIKADRLTAVSLANSDKLNVGDFVVAIGNPFGLGQTVTSGIVSALGRSGLGIEGFEDFIQTDASINPGNSGGALVNLRGELVGINTAILSQSGGNIGIGFAIPINMAADIKQQLLKFGTVKRGRLGAQAQNLTAHLAKAFGLPMQHGAIVTHIEKNSAADKAGLKPGDIITNVNGRQIKNKDILRNAVGLLRVGQIVQMEVVREGKKLTLSAKVAQAVNHTLRAENIHRKLAGAILANIPIESRYYGRIDGVIIQKIESASPAQTAGLRVGDVIVSVNRQAIKNTNDLVAITEKQQSLLLNIQRGNRALFLYLQ